MLDDQQKIQLRELIDLRDECKADPSPLIYAKELPTFDSICGTFRLHPTENAFYETLDDGTVLRYELTEDGRLFQLEDLSEVDPDEVPGSAVA